MTRILIRDYERYDQMCVSHSHNTGKLRYRFKYLVSHCIVRGIACLCVFIWTNISSSTRISFLLYCNFFFFFFSSPHNITCLYTLSSGFLFNRQKKGIFIFFSDQLNIFLLLARVVGSHYK